MTTLEAYGRPDTVVIPDLPEGNSIPHLVTLDGRAIATPFGNLIVLPGASLAHGLAGEWIAQVDRIKPAIMPLMTLCTTALDIVPRVREKTVNDCVKFLSTDTVCFFADPNEEPGLRELQEEAFVPIIEWFNKRFGVELMNNQTAKSRDILFVQPDEIGVVIGEAVSKLNDWELSALDKASGEAKSTAVAMMLCSGQISAKDALDACKTEERYQMERWGNIPHWHGIDQGLSRLLLSSVQFYMACLKEEGISKF